MVVLGFSWLYIKCSSRMVLVLHSLQNSVGIKVKVLPSYMSTVASPIIHGDYTRVLAYWVDHSLLFLVYIHSPKEGSHYILLGSSNPTVCILFYGRHLGLHHPSPDSSTETNSEMSKHTFIANISAWFPSPTAPKSARTTTPLPEKLEKPKWKGHLISRNHPGTDPCKGT